MHPTHLLVRNVQVDLGWNASRLGLEVESMSRSCHINSPGGQLVTNHIVRRVPLKLQGKIFHTSFIILPTQKVDIILGMNWMEDQGVLLDTLFTICAHQIFSSWFYDSTSYGPWIIDPCGESS